mmetsp:Transcript_16605/g.28276  ORF Transcript_16605/g.28276 Transcript_16605/m.28276 type:complete len:305 (+) Transcript_16605:440-1354(+)
MFMANSFVEYGFDLVLWRTDAISFKTVEFMKRNFNRVRSTMAHLLYEVRKVKQGFGRFKRDILFFMGVQRKNIELKYQADNYMENVKVRQVKIDVIKFIPFSFFILIPGAEILLPPFLVIFPNSVPSQFMSDQARAKKYEQIKERRINAARHLVQLLPNYLYSLEKDSQVGTEDIAKIQQLKSDFKKAQLLPTDLLQYKYLFKRFADFRYFNVKNLQKIAYFMSLEPVTGLNTINNLLSVFKLRIPIDTPGLNFLTKAILVRELNMYFGRIRKEDESLSFEHLDKYSEEQIDAICFRRGIDIDT